MPDGTEDTLPPDVVDTESVTGFSANVAVTERACDIETVQLPVPAQLIPLPDQPVNDESPDAAANSVTIVFAVKSAVAPAHAAPQSMPAGPDVTVPVPENESSGVRLIESVIRSLDIPYYIIDGPEDVGVLQEAYDRSRAERGPVVVLVSAPTS